MGEEAHQRQKKTMVTSEVEDEEDDVDPMIHHTKGEIDCGIQSRAGNDTM